MLLDKNNVMLHWLQANILGQRIQNCLLSKMSNVKVIYFYYSSDGNCENFFCTDMYISGQRGNHWEALFKV